MSASELSLHSYLGPASARCQPSRVVPLRVKEDTREYVYDFPLAENEGTGRVSKV